MIVEPGSLQIAKCDLATQRGITLRRGEILVMIAHSNDVTAWIGSESGTMVASPALSEVHDG